MNYGNGTTANASNQFNNINASQPSIDVNISINELFVNKITFVLWNSSGLLNITVFSLSNNYTNTTINWSIPLGIGYNEGLTYYYNVTVNDTVGNVGNLSLTSTNVTIRDNIGPHVTFVNPVGTPYRNHTGTIILNATITDRFNNVQLVLFNITNATSRTVSLLTASNRSATNWNVTLPSGNGSFPDGVYNITVIVNDTISNVNNTGVGRLFGPYSVIIDNSGPSVTLASLSATTSSLGVTITATETVSSINGACTVDRSGATITGSSTTTSTTQNITESGLDCGHSYAYIATCTNYAGKGGSSAATSFSTSDCGTSGGSSGGGGGGGSATVWSSTYIPKTEELQSGYTQKLGAKARIKLSINDQEHYVGVKSLTATSATLEVASTPVTMSLNVGEDTKVDVTNDGYYDLYAKLLSIKDGKAEVTVKTIYEKVPEAPAAEDTGETIQEGPISDIVDKGKANLTWLWVLIIVVVVVAIAWIIYANKKRR